MADINIFLNSGGDYISKISPVGLTHSVSYSLNPVSTTHCYVNLPITPKIKVYKIMAQLLFTFNELLRTLDELPRVFSRSPSMT